MLETGVPIDEARVGALLRRVPDERRTTSIAGVKAKLEKAA